MAEARTGRSRAVPGVGLALAFALALPGAAGSQEAAELVLHGPDGTVRSFSMADHRGYDAVPATAFVTLGWSVEAREGEWLVRHPTGTVIHLVEGTPFFHWNDDLLQLVGSPYVFGEDVFAPAQLFLDYLPARLPGAYSYMGVEEDRPVLRILDAAYWSAAERAQETAPRTAPARAAPEPVPAAVQATPALEPDVPRVVVIDAGHGGRDPGTTGGNGTREKDVALAVAQALAAELEGHEGIEVHMTRDEDVLVPIWRRGQWATDRKGERPGVFISLHANALPGQPSARGFETYFLSDARTEHERRVVANENAPLIIDREEGLASEDPNLDFILKELRNLDTQHWSALFAELVQEELGSVHPGPDRGVKQGSLAVITNALMPAVLVEIGFLSNAEEELLLNRPRFQTDVARAVASAVERFFQRYPPGRTGATGPGAAPRDRR